MLVGIFEGAYSTIFIASPIVYMWTKASDKRRKARELARYGQGLVPHRAAAPEAQEEQLVEQGASPIAVGQEPVGREPAAAAQPSGLPQQPAAFQAPQAPPAAEKPAVAPPAEGVTPGGPQPAAAAVPQPAAAGGYIRVQRRHKKRRR
jgi:hypothetical protein